MRTVQFALIFMMMSCGGAFAKSCIDMQTEALGIMSEIPSEGDNNSNEAQCRYFRQAARATNEFAKKWFEIEMTCPSEEVVGFKSKDYFEMAANLEAMAEQPCSAQAGTPQNSTRKEKSKKSDKSAGDGVKDARSCIDVVTKGRDHTFTNSCPFPVYFLHTSRYFTEIQIDYGYMSEAPNGLHYGSSTSRNFKSEVIWACGKGAPGCSKSIALAKQKSYQAEY